MHTLYKRLDTCQWPDWCQENRTPAASTMCGSRSRSPSPGYLSKSSWSLEDLLLEFTCSRVWWTGMVNSCPAHLLFPEFTWNRLFKNHMSGDWRYSSVVKHLPSVHRPWVLSLALWINKNTVFLEQTPGDSDSVGLVCGLSFLTNTWVIE
jgi:hypothetical protein